MEEENVFAKNIEKLDEFTDRSQLEKVREMRQKFIDEVDEGRILDAGCGPGRDVDFFTENGFEAVGIDSESKIIEYARENYSGIFRQMDFTELDFESESFEGVWCLAVLHLLNEEEREKAYKEIYRVLKDQGIAMISLKKGGGHVVDEKFGEEVKEHHLMPEKVRKVLKETGFEIEDKIENSSKGDDYFTFLLRKTT